MLKEKWEFGVLGVYDYNEDGTLDGYFDFVKKNVDKIDGDIVEAGVFNGKSLLGMALLLKEIGSDKKVYGFDSFNGFPTEHKNDDLSRYADLYAAGKINKEHLDKVMRNKFWRESLLNLPVNVNNISKSANFSDANRRIIEKKIELLNLDNIVLLEGDFLETMIDSNGPTKIMAGLIDCDLYSSHQISLPYIWRKLVVGGYLYLDEYYSLKFPGAKIAADEFFNTLADKPQMETLEIRDFQRWFVLKSKA